jgi:hypothetical protein
MRQWVSEAEVEPGCSISGNRLEGIHDDVCASLEVPVHPLEQLGQLFLARAAEDCRDDPENSSRRDLFFASFEKIGIFR